MKPKILIVEDVPEICDLFMNVFQSMLPMAELEFTYASTIEAAYGELDKPWSAILMDYTLGAPFQPANGEKELRTGADLVKLRRHLEKHNKLTPAFIIGTASAAAGNTLLTSMGANARVLKMQIMELAQLISRNILNGK